MIEVRAYYDELPARLSLIGSWECVSKADAIVQAALYAQSASFVGRSERAEAWWDGYKQAVYAARGHSMVREILTAEASIIVEEHLGELRPEEIL